MKKLLYILIFLLFPFVSFSQERIFSIGYGKTYVENDSTTVSVTIDLNRIPGQSEKAGGYYFVNEVIDSTKVNSRWGYYIKPTVDINIGSSTSSAPNNISLGVPVGLVYDFKETNIGIFSFYIDGAPELVADKSFNNNLYYFSINAYIKYEINHDKFLINLLTGLSNANGERDQYALTTDSYGRFTIPLFLKFSFWNTIANEGTIKEKKYKRINWSNWLKFNSVYKDAININEKKNYTFFNSKLDFYLTPNLGLNITYYNGNEEPIFKRNNSLTFGITLAR